MEQQKNGGASKRKRTFWGKPNWVATLLVAVLLIGGWYYLGDDVSLFAEAYRERAALAEMAEDAVRYSAGTTHIDLEKVKEEARAIEAKVQTLTDKTDIGEYFAANDLTDEGRDTNSMVLWGIFAIFAGGVMYLLTQVIHVMVCIVKACGKKKHNSRQTDVVA